MAKRLFLVSTKKPGLEFRVRKLEQGEAGAFTATLEGSHGVTFQRTLSEDILQKYGYRMDQREVEDAV